MLGREYHEKKLDFVWTYVVIDRRSLARISQNKTDNRSIVQALNR